MTLENVQVKYNPSTDPIRRTERWSDIRMFARISGLLIASSFIHPFLIAPTTISLLAMADLYRSYDRDYLSQKPHNS